VLVLKLVLRDRLRDMGLGLGSLGQHWGWYVLLASPILVFVVLASYRPDFIDYYPFYRQAHLSWTDLLLWELIYLLQFVCLEFFFRGFFVHALRPAMGVNAVFVMCVPYLMIHFPKPWLEATGAILFGLFLGVLSLRSRSIWGGVAVHVAIAASMDIAALIQGPGLPERLFRF
jgi:membrane protease YdiL (CAAX protease family)